MYRNARSETKHLCMRSFPYDLIFVPVINDTGVIDVRCMLVSVMPMISKLKLHIAISVPYASYEST